MAVPSILVAVIANGVLEKDLYLEDSEGATTKEEVAVEVGDENIDRRRSRV